MFLTDRINFHLINEEISIQIWEGSIIIYKIKNQIKYGQF